MKKGARIDSDALVFLWDFQYSDQLQPILLPQFRHL